MKTSKIVAAILVAASLSACASSPSISYKESVAQRQAACKAEGMEYRQDNRIWHCMGEPNGVIRPTGGYDVLWVEK